MIISSVFILKSQAVRFRNKELYTIFFPSFLLHTSFLLFPTILLFSFPSLPVSVQNSAGYKLSRPRTSRRAANHLTHPRNFQHSDRSGRVFVHVSCPLLPLYLSLSFFSYSHCRLFSFMSLFFLASICLVISFNVHFLVFYFILRPFF